MCHWVNQPTLTKWEFIQKGRVENYHAVTTIGITPDLQKQKRKPGLGSLIAELRSCQTRKEH